VGCQSVHEGFGLKHIQERIEMLAGKVEYEFDSSNGFTIRVQVPIRGGDKKMIRIMIAEDQELIRQSLEIMLSSKPDIQIVATDANGLETVEMVPKLLPDVILMDIRMPELDGVQCIEIIKGRFPQIKIIVLTTFDDEYVFNALKNGASYLKYNASNHLDALNIFDIIKIDYKFS
jgi:CheY-like chemotaxis protein